MKANTKICWQQEVFILKLCSICHISAFISGLVRFQPPSIKIHICHLTICPTWRCVNHRSGRAVAVSIRGDHRDVVHLTTADSCHIAGALGRALAGCGLSVTVLHCGDVGVSSWALRPGHKQSIGLTVHHRRPVCRDAWHWREEIKS